MALSQYLARTLTESPWERMVEKLRSYDPELMGQWENRSRAYQLRYLAHTAVTLEGGSVAVDLFHRALACYWRILLEEPRRTLLTGGAAYLLCLLPQSFYKTIEATALKLTGATQSHRILQEQSGQSA